MHTWRKGEKLVNTLRQFFIEGVSKKFVVNADLLRLNTPYLCSKSRILDFSRDCYIFYHTC